MPIARPFTAGQNQAIRIPKEYRLPNEDIFINQVGDTITLTPVSKLRDSFIRVLGSFTDDYMKEGRPPQINSKRYHL